MVETVTATQITTIEGNYNNKVTRRTYKIGDSSIAGYGRPKFDPEPAAAPVKPVTPTPAAFRRGDLVKITGKTYYNGKTIPVWVRLKNWYVLEVNGKRIVIDKDESGKNSICSAVHADNLQLVRRKDKTVDELAREVLDGKWGTGADRKKRLTDAGYDYAAVQKRVNELLR